ncbi:MAG: PAS domain S-box protein [Candidatus Glassbacteria bacterium]
MKKKLADTRKTVEKLRNSLRILRLVMDNLSAVCFVKDAQGRYLLINRLAEEILGLTNDQVVGKTPFEVFPKDFATSIWNEDLAVIESGKPLTTEVRLHQDKNKIYLQTKTPLLGEDGSVIGICNLATEITAQKDTENLLRQREETVMAILNASVEPMMLLDTEGRILRLNDTAALQFEVKVEELVGQSIYDFMPKEVAESRKNYHDIVLQWSMPVRFEEKRKGLIFDTTIQPDFDVNGKIVRLAVFARDITQQKKAVKELKEREERYAKLFDSLLDAAFLIDADSGIIHEANHQAEILLGRKHDEIVGMHYTELHPPEEIESYQRQFDDHVEKGTMENVEAAMLTGNNSRIPVMMSSQLLSVGGNDHLLRICRDLTLFKLIVEKHSRPAAADTQSSLAAGIAHDLGNVLTVLLGSLEMLREKRGKDIELQEIFKDLENSGNTARELIRRLQQLAGGGPEK